MMHAKHFTCVTEGQLTRSSIQLIVRGQGSVCKHVSCFILLTSSSSSICPYRGIQLIQLGILYLTLISRTLLVQIPGRLENWVNNLSETYSLIKISSLIEEKKVVKINCWIYDWEGQLMLHDFPFTVDIIELRNDLKLRTSWETTLYRWKNSFFRSQSASVKRYLFLSQLTSH